MNEIDVPDMTQALAMVEREVAAVLLRYVHHGEAAGEPRVGHWLVLNALTSLLARGLADRIAIEGEPAREAARRLLQHLHAQIAPPASTRPS